MVLKHEDRVAWEEGSLADTLECFPKRARQCRSLMFTWADAGGNSLSLPREPTFASPPSNLIIKSEQNQGAAERIKAVQLTWNINSTFVDVLVCAARRATLIIGLGTMVHSHDNKVRSYQHYRRSPRFRSLSASFGMLRCPLLKALEFSGAGVAGAAGESSRSQECVLFTEMSYLLNVGFLVIVTQGLPFPPGMFKITATGSTIFGGECARLAVDSKCVRRLAWGWGAGVGLPSRMVRQMCGSWMCTTEAASQLHTGSEGTRLKKRELG